MLPERINAIKTVTYDVPELVKDLENAGAENVTIGDIIEYIEDWLTDDFGGDAYGVILQDENGEEL